MHPDIKKLKEATQICYDLGQASNILSWDQQVYMPTKGAQRNAEVQATLQKLVHEKFISEEVERAIIEAEDAYDKLTNDERRLVKLTRKLFDKEAKLPADFVHRRSVSQSEGYEAWRKARDEEDISLFLPSLQKHIDIAHEYAELTGFKENHYDALLDNYEPDMTQDELDPLFDELRDFLVPFIQKITNTQQGDQSILNKTYPIEQQREFIHTVLPEMGFDFERGRVDATTHPFCCSFNPNDVRLTTRFIENELMNSIGSSIHEAGHGLYEQNMPIEWYGTALCAEVSTGFHETQSRIWEVLVGLGRPFWEYFYPQLQSIFSEQLQDITLDEFYRAINVVSPSFIRTESDEVTYNIHIIIRYELEKQLLSGALSVRDLEAAWNDHYQEYLGIVPKTLKEGVLQDVHWSEGMFGYFPTYSLGNIGAVQLFVQAQKDIPNLDNHFRQGNFKILLEWLKKAVHSHGARYTTNELMEIVTGKPLSIEDYKNYLENKFPLR